MYDCLFWKVTEIVRQWLEVASRLGWHTHIHTEITDLACDKQFLSGIITVLDKNSDVKFKVTKYSFKPLLTQHSLVTRTPLRWSLVIVVHFVRGSVNLISLGTFPAWEDGFTKHNVVLSISPAWQPLSQGGWACENKDKLFRELEQIMWLQLMFVVVVVVLTVVVL